MTEIATIRGKIGLHFTVMDIIVVPKQPPVYKDNALNGNLQFLTKVFTWFRYIYDFKCISLVSYLLSQPAEQFVIIAWSF